MNIEEIINELHKEIILSERFTRSHLLTGYLTVDQARFLIEYIEQARKNFEYQKRLHVLAIKHCLRDHHDWLESVRDQ
ncbi:MAG: hypothetical protein PF495_10030 [Spirochaetales bacterium]|jgi:hypothetical protein|nr:hypothetical protein [Spirochaetales bacterium]